MTTLENIQKELVSIFEHLISLQAEKSEQINTKLAELLESFRNIAEYSVTAGREMLESSRQMQDGSNQIP